MVDDPGCAARQHSTVVSLCGWFKEERDPEHSCRTHLRCLHEHDCAWRIHRPVAEPPDKETRQQQRREFGPQLLKLLEDPKIDVFFWG